MRSDARGINDIDSVNSATFDAHPLQQLQNLAEEASLPSEATIGFA